MLQPAGIEGCQQRRRRIVIQMTKRPADSPFKGFRIGPFGQHVGIVIAFEYQGITIRELGLDMRGDVAGVSEQAEAARAIGKYELTGLARIVRNCIRMYGDGVDGKFIVCSEEPALGEAICFRCTECGVSTWQ